MTSELAFRRRAVNAVMLTATGLCTLLASGTLLFILGYLAVHGGSSLSWNFFTKLPTPVGESGGGMANAIVGSAKVLLIATLLGVPAGFLAGVYVSEYAGAKTGALIRFTADLLNGIPSIVTGIFAYTLIVLNTKHFSAYAGGVALGVMMIPIALRTTEGFLRAVPESLREGAMALGASKEIVISTVVIPAAMRGIVAAVASIAITGTTGICAQNSGPQIYSAAMSADYNPLLWTGDNAVLARDMIQESRCEAELSEIVGAKSSNPGVQRLAAALGRTESKVHREFLGMARTINFHLISKKDAPPCNPAARIAELRGEDLDRAFVEYVFKTNAADISRFQAELELLTDPQNYNLRQMAKKTLPMLKAEQEEIAAVKDVLCSAKK